MAAWMVKLLAWLVLPGLIAGGLADRQVITVTSNTAQVTYPQAVTFQLSASSPVGIRQAFLVYGTSKLSCQGSSSRQAISFEPANDVQLSWKLDFNHSGVVPPGAEIWWQWEISDSTGATLQTEKKTTIVQDDRFAWQQLSQEGITLQWHTGSTSFGQSLLKISQESLQRISDQMGQRPTRPIWITVYASGEEMRQALVSTFDWTGGVALTEYGSIMLGLGAHDLDYASQVIPHELSHLVVAELTSNCKGVTLPTWLGEGLAMNAEGELSATDQASIQKALDKGKLPPLSSLNGSFSPYASHALQEYAQSAVVVDYLLDTYGPEKMNAVLSKVQSGQTAEKALQAEYGFGTNGLDAAWRASLGYASSTVTSAMAIQPTRTAIPTLALWGPIVQSTATPAPVASSTPTVIPTPSAAPTQVSEGTSPPNQGAGTGSGSQPRLSGSPVLPFCFGSLILTILFLFRSFPWRKE